jgi:hypothetical protein
VLDSELIWTELENSLVNLYGFTGKLSDYVIKVAALADGSLYLRPKAPAVVIEVERLCECDALGNRLKQPRYELTQADEGYMIIRRAKLPVGQLVQTATSPEVIDSVVLMAPPDNKK